VRRSKRIICKHLHCMRFVVSHICRTERGRYGAPAACRSGSGRAGRSGGSPFSGALPVNLHPAGPVGGVYLLGLLRLTGCGKRPDF
jgi:hypothetical protein